jgi:putative colanic acid biosysnthesis UDP-glucose lipid carrier transferase
MHCDMYCTSNNPPFSAVTDTPLQHRRNQALKRLADIVIASFALLLLGPLLGLIALAIFVEQRLGQQAGAIFYSQSRVSQYGSVFLMYKFRTMVDSAERESGPVWASEGDERTTTVGRWLRRSSLDELPQLWNVFKGEMSFVGPRPERPFFVEQFSHEIPHYQERHMVKAGLTGWAQIHGLRGNTSLKHRVEHDLYYIQHWSFTLDLQIILRSFSVLLKDYVFHKAY